MPTRFRKTKFANRRSSRQGTILPGLLVALVVTICCLALVLDKLWLDAARAELCTSTEAAALAAARELVHDDLLCDDYDSAERVLAARERAVETAWQNPVAGQPVELDLSPKGDVRFGRLAYDAESQVTRFLETEKFPRTVVVTGRCEQSRGNPIALWFRGLTGHGQGNAHCSAEATLDNRVIGVRPFENVPVPALPLAILECDCTGQRTDTWEHEILEGQGGDSYAFHPKTGKVEHGQDGLPEIHLHGMKRDESAQDANVHLVDMQTDLRTKPLLKQFQLGWTQSSLKDFGGGLILDSRSLWLTSLAALDADHADGLRQLIGQPRICLLYSDLEPAGDEGYGKLRVVGLVAGRVMDVKRIEGTDVIVFQPTVLTTRTAVLADRDSDASPPQQENPYIYKLHLTH